MLGIREFLVRYKEEVSADRIGPDMPFTHWRLYFKRLMIEMCKAKFKHFGIGAVFRPGAFAITCSKIELGDRVVIRPQSMLFADSRPDGAGISIGNGALVGSGVHIYTGNHIFRDPRIPIIDQGHSPSAAVEIKPGAWIGANAIILPGITIGENSVVGAGSIVTKSVAPRTVVAGNPATKIRDIA